MKTSDDGHITFYPETHEYFDAFGNKFQSVTTALKKFFPFEDREIAERVREMPGSIYFGQDVDKILSTWEATAPCGTGLHGACERWITTGEIIEDEHRAGAQNFAEFMSGLCPRSELHSESIVYDARIKIAGTLDILQETEEGLALWDIKTSRKIDDMKLLKFSMQLELYRRFSERNYGCRVRTRGIVWFEGYFRNPSARPRIIDPIECRREVDALIEHRRKEIAA